MASMPRPNLNGLHLTQGTEHVDNHTRVDRRVPNCDSNEVYRGVLGGKSTGVFNGKVYVHRMHRKPTAIRATGTF